MDEGDYNVILATSLEGLCLDKKLVRCQTNSRGFESCDVLMPAGVFVHVKMIGRSTGASHLFAQAGVSAQSLLYDASAESALRDMVSILGGGPEYETRPTRAILVMGSDTRLIGPGSLFPFSRMRLVRLYEELRRLNVELAVIPIRRSDSKV
jgi:uncharacterized protein (TIGR04141 family)